MHQPLPAAVTRYLRGRHRAATYLTFRPTAADDPRATKLSGQPYLLPGESWPDCTHCGQPLQHLFQLDMTQAPEPAPPHARLLTFFYCLTCAPTDDRSPGWHVLERSDLAAAPAAPAPPPVPPEGEQPGPLVLLQGRAQVAACRPGQDLPSLRLDPALRRRLVRGGNDGDRDSAAVGATQVLHVRLRHRQTGEVHDLRLPMTANTDPFSLFGANHPTHDLVSLHLGNLDLGEDHTDAYQQLLGELRGSPHVVSKLGGWLECEQTPRWQKCRCGKALAHVATIKTTNETPFVIGDIGALYLVACPDQGCSQRRLRWWLDHT